MKTVLIFKTPEESEELFHAQHGMDYYLALHEYLNTVCRPIWKHVITDEIKQRLTPEMDHDDIILEVEEYLREKLKEQLIERGCFEYL